MNAIGIAFALLTTVSWAIGIFPFTIAARRLGVNPLNHFRLALATCILFVIAFLGDRNFVHALSQPELYGAWFWLGLSGVIGLTIGDHFGFAMFTILGPRLGSVLSTFAPGAALVTGFFLANDRLSLIGILGMLITMAGVIVLSLSREERNQHQETHHGSLRKGIVYGILAAFCQGVGLVMAKKGMQLQGNTLLPPFQATFIRLFAATGSLLLTTIVLRRWRTVFRPILENKEKGLLPAIAGTFFGPVLGVSLSLFTVSFLDASVAQTIFSLVPVVALLLARIIQKDPIRPKAFAGVMVAIAGVVVLVWRDSIEAIIFG